MNPTFQEFKMESSPNRLKTVSWYIICKIQNTRYF